MTVARVSYLRTIYVSLGGVVAALAIAKLVAAVGLGPFTVPALVAELLSSCVFTSIATSVFVILHHARRAGNSEPDFF